MLERGSLTRRKSSESSKRLSHEWSTLNILTWHFLFNSFQKKLGDSHPILGGSSPWWCTQNETQFSAWELSGQGESGSLLPLKLVSFHSTDHVSFLTMSEDQHPECRAHWVHLGGFNAFCHNGFYFYTCHYMTLLVIICVKLAFPSGLKLHNGQSYLHAAQPLDSGLKGGLSLAPLGTSL